MYIADEFDNESVLERTRRGIEPKSHYIDNLTLFVFCLRMAIYIAHEKRQNYLGSSSLKIQTIKAVRGITSWGLKESKMFVDNFFMHDSDSITIEGRSYKIEEFITDVQLEMLLEYYSRKGV